MKKQILRLLVVTVICILAFADCEKTKRCQCTTYVYSPAYEGQSVSQKIEYTIKIPER